MLSKVQFKTWLRILLWAGTVVAMVAAGFFGVPAYWLSGRRVADNVYVENVPVGGLRAGEAEQAVTRYLNPPPLLLASHERVWVLSLNDCGGAMDVEATVAKALRIGRAASIFRNAWTAWRAWYYGESIPMQFRFDKRRLRRTLRRIAWTVNLPKRDARVQVVDGYVNTEEGQWGRRFNVQATAENIVRKFGLHNQSIAADIRLLHPKVMAYDLQAIDAVIGQFSTAFNPGKVNRTRNIQTVCAQINGQVVLPGETFSFNATTGERTIDKGYRVAQIYNNHEIVDGVGGGVCQVSTTLYNCVRRLRLPVVERHPHSLPVPYIRTGLDATVSYPYRDLKFKNTLATPIAIWTKVNGGRLTVYILGERGNESEFASG